MIVETKNGKVRGFEDESVAGGKKYFSYLGIPYAKPPIGDLRFSAPEPVENWNEVYDATYQRDVCFQMDPFFGDGLAGSDDCLYLNIHTPEVNPKSLKPVLFYLHGGGFFCGSGDEAFHGADYLINNDVVLVTINYRLHMLGFLNLEIAECPGNAGMKDQVLALKWVKENIEAFGGDPNNITINGCSAGASSVNLLMISPLAKGLFQKAIMQCGTALSPWSLTDDPLKWAFKAGEILGFKGDDRLELLKFFRALPGDQIVNVANRLLEETTVDHSARGLYCPFAPSVEVIEEGAFLPDTPINLMKTATPVPCIAGYATVERIYTGKYILENIANASESMIKEIIKSNFNVNDSQLASIDEKLRKLYFQQNDQTKSNMEKIDELLTDICCLYFYDALEFVAKSNSPLYVFHFAYFSENQNYVRKTFSQLYPLSKNAFHGEEQRFVLACKKFGREPFQESTDVNVQKNMCQLWTNFMKTGNPFSEGINIVWKPHTITESYHLKIDADCQLRSGKISEKRIEILRKILYGIELIK